MRASVDAVQLRAAMGNFLTGVSVVTTSSGVPHGMTANSLTCLSLDPPMVLLCLDNQTRMLTALTENGRFAVSILAEPQQSVALHFADPTRTEGAPEFSGVDWFSGSCGIPLIGGALAWIECEVETVYAGGDHQIIVGAVTSAEQTPGTPLAFFGGQLGTLVAR